jgi:hypothetical protein
MLVIMGRLTGYFNRPDRVVVGEFLDNGKPNPDYAAKFYDRWLNFRSAGLGLEETGADQPFLTGGDFVIAEIEQRTGNELEKTIGDLAKEIDIKVAGVSLQGFAKFLDLMTPRPLRTIEGRFNKFRNEITLTVTLRHRKKAEKVWSSTKTIESDTGLPTAIEDLIDEAICEVAIYLRTTDAARVSKGANSMHSIAQLTPGAIASLTKGRRSLSRYIRDNSQSDLLAAQTHFRSLVDSSSTFPEGYMMLAYTLAENRQERDAVEVYDRVIKLFGAEAREDRRRYEAQFLKACSLLRCYRWEDALMAINEFHELAAELKQQTDSQKPSEKEELDAWRYKRYLLARCYVELGHCLGHLIAFMPKDKPLQDYHYRGLEDLKNKGILKGLEVPAKEKDTFANRAEIAGVLYNASNSFKNSSEEVAGIDKEEWLAERRARIYEVGGYALYRFAEWLEVSKSDDFREMCNKAIRSLQEAELRKPRSYALLQNMAMILLSRRYDPDGVYLAQAETFCRRSVQLKPNDYYGYEQLARINLRRMLAATEQTDRDTSAREGEELVAKAQKIDFLKHGPAFLHFYFRLAKLAFQGAGVKPSDVEPLLSDIDRYEPNGRDPTYRWMRLHCYLLLLLATPNESAFNSGKMSLDKRITDYEHDFKGRGNSNWRTSQMLNSVQRLQTQLTKTTYETRTNLKFELEAALD